MKKKLGLVLTLILFLCITPVITSVSVKAEVYSRSVEDPAGPFSVVEPRWTYINSIMTNLDINSLGRADCSTSMATSSTNNLCKIHAELLQRMPGYYKTIESWDVSGYAAALLSKTTYVYSGYTYVLESKCSVWNKSGTTQLESQTVTYEEVYK